MNRFAAASTLDPLEPRSASRLVDIVFPGDTNHHGTLFGGIGLSLLDKAAWIAAARHARVDFVTASCEQVDFDAPARLGDIVEATGRVSHVGRRSLVVDVVLTAESPLTGHRSRCGGGRFHMVAVGDVVRDPAWCLPPLDEAAKADPDGMDDLVFPDRLSHYGSLHGGHALAAMARAAFVAASRHARRIIVLRSCRRVDFDDQIGEGEIVRLTPKVVETGRSSMVVAVDLSAEPIHAHTRRRSGGGEFVMVAVDESHRPVGVSR